MGWRWFGSQRHPVFCRASALGAEPTPHFLQGLDSSEPSGPLRFTRWRCLVQGRTSTIPGPAAARAAAGLFLQGGASLYMADPGADPGWNPIFYRSPVREVHFPKMAPDADPAGEPIFCRQRAPLCPLLKPDPCRIHHACHVSRIGSMRIHVADPCRFPIFYRSKKAPRVHLLKF